MSTDKAGEASSSQGEAKPSQARHGRAVVIGGSLAGSAAAAGLASWFEEVIVLDKDDLEETTRPRRFVPHGAHIHALLKRGQLAYDEILPGFTARAVELGAPIQCMTDSMSLRRFGWAPRFESDLTVLTATRPFIEGVVRELTSSLDNVSYRPETIVTGLVTSGQRVAGVRMGHAADTDGCELEADLVVEATGRQSQLPDWLTALGYPRPAETVVNAHWGYSSALVTAPRDWEPGFKALGCFPRGISAQGQAVTRGATLWMQEGERRWILTALGSARDYPPGDETALRAYIDSIGVPEISKAVGDLTFATPVHTWRSTRNRWRDFVNLGSRPENLIVVGDAVAAFNPVYGQGMTVAALAALDLRSELAGVSWRGSADDLEGFAERFQRRLADTLRFCWAISTGADYRVPGVDGPPQPEKAREFVAYADRVEALSAEDPEIWLRLLETTQLIRTPEWMYEDSVRQRVEAGRASPR